MTPKELDDFFWEHRRELSEFSRVEHPSSSCADLHAFFILDHIGLVEGAMILGVVNDHSDSDDAELVLNVSDELLAKATEQEILDLIRCGVQRTCTGRYSINVRTL
jgi:hypothetical protein